MGSRSRGRQPSYVGNYLISAQNERAGGNANKQRSKMAGHKLPESAQLGGISPIQALLTSDPGSGRPWLSSPRGLSAIHLQELGMNLVQPGALLRGGTLHPEPAGHP